MNPAATTAVHTPSVPRAYLDAATSAPLLPAAREALLAALDDGWADPRRLHREGRLARRLLDGAREGVAAALGVRTEEVTFTGTHTRAVHTGVGGILRARRRAGERVVASAVEHSAVLNAGCRDGATLERVDVDRLGRLEVEAFAARVRQPGTALACVQAANGEVGTIQPVEEAWSAARAAGVPLLMDAGAAAGHVDLPSTWDALTADAGAWGGPGQVGVLCLRAATRWLATEPEQDGVEKVAGAPGVPETLAAAVALDVAQSTRAVRTRQQWDLIEKVRVAATRVPDTEVVGDPVQRLPHVVTFSSLYVDGEALLDAFDRLGFAVGSGSACTAATVRPSHVLAAMGVLTHGNVRLGLPPAVDPAAVERFCALLPDVVADVRTQLGAADL